MNIFGRDHTPEPNPKPDPPLRPHVDGRDGRSLAVTYENEAMTREVATDLQICVGLSTGWRVEKRPHGAGWDMVIPAECLLQLGKVRERFERMERSRKRSGD